VVMLEQAMQSVFGPSLRGEHFGRVVEAGFALGWTLGAPWQLLWSRLEDRAQVQRPLNRRGGWVCACGLQE